MKKSRNILLAIVAIFNLNMSLAQSVFYNVRDYGAIGSGENLESEFIQKAVDAAHGNGGGTVYVPAGTYLSGTIILKSNVRLYVENGARILGSTDRNDYLTITPDFPSRTNDLYVNRSIIYAEDESNVSIEGKGIIDGNGLDPIFDIKRPQINRPYLVRFVNCENLTIRDINLVESANWTLHLLGCRQVVVDGIKINASHRENRDGIDVDGCQDVAISNCNIVSGDDAIVLKSTGPSICKNVTVTNCKLTSQASAFKMGTESTGGFENITFSNSIITNVIGHTGIAMMMVDGGTLKNVTINNIIMDSVNVPFFIRLGDRARPYKNGLPAPPTGVVENINISNVTVTNSGLSSHITGLHKKKIKNISFSNITIIDNQAYEGAPLAYNEVPFKETNYPMGKLYGPDLPSSTFYFRNVEGLKLDNMNIVHNAKDARPTFVFDRISDLRMKAVGSKTSEKAHLAHLRNVQMAAVFECSNYGVTENLTSIESANCANFTVQPDLMFQSQMAMKEVPALADRVFEDIKGVSFIEFDTENTQGLDAYPLSKGKRSFTLKAKEDFPFKLMILNYVENGSESLSLNVNDFSYNVELNNESWGWNAVTVEKTFKNKNVKVELIPSDNSSANVARIVLVPTKVTD
ncbi:MAG: glycosyl hydrolase family 28 protein [Cyclobacteriaceae bacterium]